LENIKEVRAQVAAGIIYDPHAGHGGDADLLTTEVAEHCVVVDENYYDVNVSGGKRRGDGPPQLSRPLPLIPGVVTALDLCAKYFLLTGLGRAAMPSIDCLLATMRILRSMTAGACRFRTEYRTHNPVHKTWVANTQIMTIHILEADAVVACRTER